MASDRDRPAADRQAEYPSKQPDATAHAHVGVAEPCTHQPDRDPIAVAVARPTQRDADGQRQRVRGGHHPCGHGDPGRQFEPLSSMQTAPNPSKRSARTAIVAVVAAIYVLLLMALAAVWVAGQTGAAQRGDPTASTMSSSPPPTLGMGRTIDLGDGANVRVSGSRWVASAKRQFLVLDLAYTCLADTCLPDAGMVVLRQSGKEFLVSQDAPVKPSFIFAETSGTRSGQIGFEVPRRAAMIQVRDGSGSVLGVIWVAP